MSDAVTRRILILEDEALLRSSMARGLRKLPGVEVSEAGTVAEASAILDRAPPDLVFSDIDLPDRTGIEILGELGKRGVHVPVVFISAFLRAYGPQIPRHANVDVRSKPVSIEELRAIAVQRLNMAPDAASSPFSAVDYLQLSCMGRHTVEIVVRRDGKVTGRIQVVAGELWAAEDEKGAGVEAFRRVAFGSGGDVECRTLRDAPRQRNIDASWEELALEAARLEDEAAQKGVPQAAPAAAPRPSPLPDLAPATAAPGAAADPFDAAWEEAVSALLARDHARAYALFLEAGRLRPGDRKVEANLARLRDMGIGGVQPPRGGK